MLKVGDKFPEFNLTAVTGSNHETDFHNVSLETYQGKWLVVFFWPKDFTFVCPTEIIGFGDINSDLADRDTQLLGASTDSDFVHAAWRQHHEGLKDSPFPWLADINKALSNALGIVNHEVGVANRATFIVDPEHTIRYVEMTDLSIGRDPKDTLRILDALQTGELCPCARPVGGDTL
jgi:peroxiredoxin (alkyl hydroperoxide reductase subunit C)